jgi:pimeloyl-ACP methyl ester carboxylesterase
VIPSGVRPTLAAPTLAATSDVTSTLERRRVDRVPTPKLDWFSCSSMVDCATVRLPRDYDTPKGATTEIAVVRVKARDPKRRIGTLFVNPGGPGGSGVALAVAAPDFLSDAVLDRFDIVGFDPRGIGSSERLACFRSLKERTRTLAGMSVAFPMTATEQQRYLASAKGLGKGCSTVGRPLAGAMSTAEAARDMDVLRRAVGDAKLTYLGFSYGTALGQYYANMFPDRVRAVAVDGVINPSSWTGTSKTRNQILDDRLRSADGAYKALHEMLVRCGRQGQAYCQFASGGGNPVTKFRTLAQRLQTRPVQIDDGSGTVVTISYADVVAAMLSFLYSPNGFALVDLIASALYDLSEPAGYVSSARLAASKRNLATWIRGTRKGLASRDFAYDNSIETFSAVTCTDALHPAKAEDWPAMTARADRRAPYFGRIWGWSSVQCAGNAWTVRDQDAYTGPFNRRTSAPVLFVGNRYDPATNYAEAVSSSSLLPGSRLLSSDSWGHTAYGTSACVTDAVDAYLVGLRLPKQGTVCVGDVQPFTEPLPTASTGPKSAGRTPPTESFATAASGPASANGKHLPPVYVLPAPSVLLGTR